MTTVPVAAGGSERARHAAHAMSIAAMTAMFTIRIGSTQSVRIMVVVSIPKTIAGRANSVTRRSKTGWWESSKTPRRFRSWTTTTIRRNITIYWSMAKVTVSTGSHPRTPSDALILNLSLSCRACFSVVFDRAGSWQISHSSRKITSGMVARLTI